MFRLSIIIIIITTIPVIRMAARRASTKISKMSIISNLVLVMER